MAPEPTHLNSASKLLVFIGLLLASDLKAEADDVGNAGFLYDRFDLTLESGRRTEIAGPLFFLEEEEDATSWGFPPVFSTVRNEGVENRSFDLVYPFITYDRYGQEYRFQIFQLFSFSGGESLSETIKKRTTLFPFYFRQQSTDPEENYFAFVPFYGHLRNRLLRDEIRFVLFPIYGQSRKRDVVTDNYLYPLFHVRRGTGLSGWQFWPFFGLERRVPTEITNSFGDPDLLPGHRKMFVLWPFFHKGHLGIGSTNEQRQQLFFPFYSFVRSEARDSTTFPWPIGYTHTEDREKKFKEWGAPWPFIVFARGEGKTVNRVWPLFSEARSEILQSRFYLWPVFKENRIHSPPLDRRRSRVLFFLYQDWRETNLETEKSFRRRDFWPLYTHRQERNGNERLQILAPLEPFLPTNASIERNYSPIWSIWRSEKNESTGESSQSLLWNLYRKESSPEAKKVSIFLGLFQYDSGAAGRRWRLLYIPIGGSGE
jgi:hypothetical protein